MRSRLHHPTKPTSHKKRTYVHWLSHVRALLIARTCIKQRTYVHQATHVRAFLSSNNNFH